MLGRSKSTNSMFGLCGIDFAKIFNFGSLINLNEADVVN